MTMEPQSASDYSLVLATSRWDQTALQEIYRRYAGAVYGVARRILADEVLAQDVAQETFLDLWNNPEKFDPERGSLRAFLLMKAHGRSVDTVRSEEARRVREEKVAAWETAEVADVDAEMIGLVRGEKVRAALAGLSDKERVPIQLAYFKGLTYREVAEALDEPEGTIKSRIRAGMKRLRGSLEEVRS